MSARPLLSFALLALLTSLTQGRAAADEGEAPVEINKCCWKSESWDLEQAKCVAPKWQKHDEIREEKHPPIDLKDILDVFRSRSKWTKLDETSREKPVPPMDPEEVSWLVEDFPSRPKWTKLDETRRERLVPPMDPKEVDWLPEVLRSRPVLAHFDAEISGNHFAFIVDADGDTINKFLRMNGSAGVFTALESFHPPLDASAVYGQSFCVDRLATGKSRVLVSGALTRQLNKCCPMDQRLAAGGRRCEKLPAGRAAAWLPASPLANATGVRLRNVSNFPWNVKVRTDKADDSSWRLMAPPNVRNYRVWVREQGLEGVAWNYCFDEMADGESASSTLLAAVAEVRKCCGRGQRLSEDGQRCEAFTAGETAPPLQPYNDREGEDGEVELVGRLGEEDLEASPWISPGLSTFLDAGDGKVTVAYSTRWNLQSVTVLDADEEDAWSVEFPSDSPPQLRLTRPVPGGAAVHQLIENYCFEAQAFGRRVLLVEARCEASGVLCVPKCCPAGRLLNSVGGCSVRPPSPRSGPPPRDWDPSKSSVAKHLPPNLTALAHFSLEDHCLGSAYTAQELTPKDAARLLRKRSEERFHCADLLLPAGEGEGEREVFAYCESPPVETIVVLLVE